MLNILQIIRPDWYDPQLVINKNAYTNNIIIGNMKPIIPNNPNMAIKPKKLPITKSDKLNEFTPIVPPKLNIR